MLKLIVKLVFGVFGLLMLVVIVNESEYREPKHVLSLILGFGVFVYAAIDLWEFIKSKKENGLKVKSDAEKRMRDIQFDFANNYFLVLAKLGVVEDKSEVTYEWIYSISKNTNEKEKITANENHPIIDSLEEFSGLYEQHR